MDASNITPAAHAAGAAPKKEGGGIGAPRIIQELARAINRSPIPAKVFYAVLHYTAATANAVPDAEKVTIFRRLAAEWDELAGHTDTGTV